MKNNITKLYVVKPIDKFEQIKDKINACLSQFNVEIETNQKEL